MSESLIARWLDDRDSLADEEAAELSRLLAGDPGLAGSVKDQLAIDHLLSLTLAVDRRRFEEQVAQRIRAAESGAAFERSTMAAVRRAGRRSWRSWIPEAAAAAILLLGLLILLPRWRSTPTTTPAAPRPAPSPGLRAEYFRNLTLSGSPLVRVDPKLNFEWSPGGGPVPEWGDLFSARWTGWIEPKFSEVYTIRVRNDDAVRVWIDGKRIIDDWTGRPVVAQNQAQVALRAGRRAEFKVEYYNGGDRGVLSFSWSSPSQKEEAIPPSAFSRD